MRYRDFARPLAEAMVDREDFRAWFAGSKIVDAAGQPLKLYRGLHGPHVGAMTSMEPRPGYAMFFTTSPHVAASYANLRRFVPLDGSDDPDNVGAIFPVYVRATVLHEYPVRNGRFDFAGFDTVASRLAPGHGVVARNVVDIGPRADPAIDPERLYSYRSDIYGFGRGTSIKSAVSHLGHFDAANPSMTESAGTGPSPELMARYRAFNTQLFDGALPDIPLGARSGPPSQPIIRSSRSSADR